MSKDQYPKLNVEYRSLKSWMLRRLFFPSLLFKQNAGGPVLEGFALFRVLVILFLVIRLRWIEFHRWQDCSHDRFFEFAGPREVLFLSLGNFFLSRIGITNRGPITRADIGQLAVGLSGIDLPPIDVQELLVGNLRRVV